MTSVNVTQQENTQDTQTQAEVQSNHIAINELTAQVSALAKNSENSFTPVAHLTQ